MRKTIVIALLILGAGCSSSSTMPGGGGGAGGQANNDGATNTDGAATFTLKLENFLSWCVVTEQGTDEGTTDGVTTTYPAGTVVNLMGAAASASFVWDYWVGTDGDTTAAHDTNMTTTVTMTSNKTIQACCPITPAAGLPPDPCSPPT